MCVWSQIEGAQNKRQAEKTFSQAGSMSTFERRPQARREEEEEVDKQQAVEGEEWQGGLKAKSQISQETEGSGRKDNARHA